MRQRLRSPLGAFLAYLAASFAFFGLRVAGNPRTELIGTGADPAIFVWSFAWWPHALLNGRNPFDADVIWAPDGIDLSWVTTVPLLSVLYSPLTLAIDPGFAYNVAAVLAPALAGTTCFLLCRYLTGTFWPALAAGFTFGFSAYMVGHTLGHVHLTNVFPIPLIALFVVQRVRGDLGARQAAIRLGITLAVLLWIGTELFFTATVFLTGAGLLNFLVRAVWELNFNGTIPQRPQLEELIRVKDVDRIVVSTGYHQELWRSALEWLGPPSVVGGVAVYPRCSASMPVA